MIVSCPHCKKPVRVSDDSAGKLASCPLCTQPFTAPAETIPVAELGTPKPRPRPAPRRERYEPPPVRREEEGYRCPFCKSPEYPVSTSKITGGGWTLFFLMLFGGGLLSLTGLLCLPMCLFFLGPLLCWLPLVLMKRIGTRCVSCGMRLS